MRTRLIGAACVGMLSLCPAVARAQITVTGGHAQFVDGPDYGPFIITSPDRGVSLAGAMNIEGPEPPFDRCNFDPNNCQPGHTIPLTVFGDSGETGAIGTIDGKQFQITGGAANSDPGAWNARFDGSVTLPAWAAHTTVSAPVTFSGSVNTGSEQLTLSGTATATVYLDENTNIPGTWRITRILYAFNQGLPDLWTSFDVGLVGRQGSAHYSAGVFDVTGSGGNIWGTADGFQFVFADSAFPAALPTQVTARVVSMENTDFYAKAGVMARGGLAADAPHVILDVNPNGNVEFNTRPSAGAPTTYLGGIQAAFPVWLRLSEAGTGASRTVTASVSQNGTAWTEIGHVANQGGYLGLVVNSRNNSLTNTASFDNVSTSSASQPAQLPAPWQQSDVGQTGAGGTASFSNGTFTVQGAGADIWTTTDAFHYVYQPVSGDFQIIARTVSMQNTQQWAKAGVMLRASSAPDAAFVMVDETPGGTIEFITRASTGAVAQGISNGTQPTPAWLRLTRSGGTVSADMSSDGSSWLPLGSTPASFAAANIGLIVCSHDASQLNTATFDHVSVSTPSSPPPPNSNIVIYGSDVQASALHGDWTIASDGTSPNGVKLQSSDAGFAATDAALANPANYFDVAFNANAGVPYRIWVRIEASGNSKFNDSLWMQFGDAQIGGTAAYPTGTANGLLVNLATDSSASSLNNWGWQNTAYWLNQPTTVTFPTTGAHTLRIQVREDGVALDQIVLSPSTYLSSAPGGPTNDGTVAAKP